MLLDVFRSSAFDFTSLTQSILKLPYKPSRLGELGLFQEKGISTLTVRWSRAFCPTASLRATPRCERGFEEVWVSGAPELNGLHRLVLGTLPSGQGPFQAERDINISSKRL